MCQEAQARLFLPKKNIRAKGGGHLELSYTDACARVGDTSTAHLRVASTQTKQPNE